MGQIRFLQGNVVSLALPLPLLFTCMKYNKLCMFSIHSRRYIVAFACKHTFRFQLLNNEASMECVYITVAQVSVAQAD